MAGTGTMCKAILFLVFLTTLGLGNCLPTVELRLNYGVWFEQLEKIQNVNSAWRHIPKLRIPRLEWVGNVTVCKPITGPTPFLRAIKIACREYDQMLQRHHIERTRIVQRINSLAEQVDGMLPAEIPDGDRKARSPFDFIGSAVSWLFGVATNKQVSEVIKRVTQLSTSVTQSDEKSYKFREKTLSVLNVTNERIAILSSNQKHINQDLAKVIDKFHTWQIQFLEASTALHALTRFPLHVGKLIQILTTDLTVLLELEEASQQYLIGIQALSEGYLPLTLIPPGILTNTLRRTAERLGHLYPTYRLRHPESYHYYRTPTVDTINSGDNLYVQITIPVDGIDPVLTLYRVRQLPLPVQRNGTGATEIQNLPTYFAVDASHTWYHDMTSADLASCKGTVLSRCNRLFTLRHRNSPTCAAALYFRDSDKVGTICQTIIRTYHVFVDNAEDLGSGRILLSNPHNRVSLICPKSVSKTLPVSSISIVQVPCAVAYLAGFFGCPEPPPPTPII